MKHKNVIRQPKNHDPLEAGLSQLIPENVQRPNGTHRRLEREEENEREIIRGLDPMTEQLGCQSFHENMIWDWFRYPENGLFYRMSVSRFYSQRSLAIDLKLSSEESKFIELKSRLLKKNGISYFHLRNDDDFRQMLREIENN